jgi:hypothetical protein
VRDQESSHLSGSNHRQARLGERKVQVLLRKHFTELDGRRRNTDGSFGNGSLRTNSLSSSDSLIEQTREDLSTAAILFDGMKMALADLGKNLTLSNYKRIKSS